MMSSQADVGTVGALVRAAAERYGDVTAVVHGETRWSYHELVQRIEEMAQSFLAFGLDPGDRFSIWAENRWEWIVAALGGLIAGGVLVPLNTRYKGAEAADILGRSRARLLVTVDEFLGTRYVDELANYELPDLESIVVMGGHTRGRTQSWDDFTATKSTRSALDDRIAQQAPTDISDIVFTSGTTGRPKGVMTTHQQNLRVFQIWADTIGLRREDRYLMINPYFHTFGYKAGILASFLQGATMYPVPVFDVERVLALIETEKITMLPGAPTVYLSILNHPGRERYALDSLRLAVTGAAVVPIEMILRMRSELSFDTIVTAYGLSESTGTISCCRPDDPPELIASTSGRPIEGVEVKVVDADRQEVPRGTPGEIACRGHNVMVGYFEDPAATAEVIDAEGWLYTGDIGVLDDNDYVAITDRKKDMFIVGGFNTYPAEVENALLAHPGIAQVAVIGVLDDRLGEVGHAYAVARQGITLDPQEVIEWARPRMANYKVPRLVHLMDALPMNASGKVLKHVLRDG